MSRFLYLNIYSFLLILAGALVFLLPFYKINTWILIIQIIVGVKILLIAVRLFSAWDDKKRKREILLSKNREEFRPESFTVFMQAPCGRLLVRSVLLELGMTNEYKNLLKLKKPVWASIKENCTPVKSVVFVNENAL